MARNYNSSFYQPDKDAGWGLIFRLNDLWQVADRRCLRGDYDGWELVLDSILRNLLYRKEPEVIKNEKGEIVDVEFTEEDLQAWKIMKNKIRAAKNNKKDSAMKKGKDYTQACEDYYNAIFFYDIWVRKFMQKHGLYLKEIEHNPSKALFGGAFSKYQT